VADDGAQLGRQRLQIEVVAAGAEAEAAAAGMMCRALWHAVGNPQSGKLLQARPLPAVQQKYCLAAACNLDSKCWIQEVLTLTAVLQLQPMCAAQ
jgi:hypothetical protein